MAEDDRFSNELTNEDIDSFCEDADAALNDFSQSDNLDVDFSWDGDDRSCGGSFAVSTESKSVIVTGHLSFSPLTSSQQKELAEIVIDNDADVGECSFTDILVSGVSDPKEGETSKGNYCSYTEGGQQSYSAYALGAFVAGNSTISVEFSSTDDEPDSDQVQQGIDEALQVTMESLRAEAP